MDLADTPGRSQLSPGKGDAVSVPASSKMSAVAMVAVAGAMLSSAQWVKTLKLPYVDASASPAMWDAPTARSSIPARAAKFVRGGTIASATSPLNLRKLTMSDFGDVDGLR